MESWWVQAEGQPSRQLRLFIGSTVEVVLGILQAPDVKFKLKDGSYAAVPVDLALDDLRAECTQDGRSDTTALQLRFTQAQELASGRLEGKVDKLLSLMAITQQLTAGQARSQLDELMYTEGRITCRNDAAAIAFGRAVKCAYHALGSRQDLCWCLLTNAELPASTVIGAHLFTWQWHDKTHVLGLNNINEVGNGLPVWRPIEWAYNTSRLCFVHDKSKDEFVAHVLDNSILGMPLAEQGQELMGTAWRAPAPQFRALTYQDMHLRPLTFAPRSLQRPTMRILNFQARQARKYEIWHGWHVQWANPLWDFEDFWTEGLEVSEKMKHWFSTW